MRKLGRFFLLFGIVCCASVTAVTFPIFSTNFARKIFSESYAFCADLPFVEIGEETWIYDEVSGKKIFLLPTGYYAAMENIVEGYYVIRFNGIKGKVNKEKVSVVGYDGTPPDTIKELQLDEKYLIFSEIRLKTSMEGGEEFLVPTNDSIIFLGKYPTDEEMFYYVRHGDNTGYISAEYTSLPDIVIDPFSPDTGDIPILSPPTEEGMDVTKILVITVVCIAIAVLVVIIFLPKKKGKHRYYYEDCDV